MPVTPGKNIDRVYSVSKYSVSYLQTWWLPGVALEPRGSLYNENAQPRRVNQAPDSCRPARALGQTSKPRPGAHSPWIMQHLKPGN
jgi:hypothetical protein